jgi:hypothetical protein
MRVTIRRPKNTADPDKLRNVDLHAAPQTEGSFHHFVGHDGTLHLCVTGDDGVHTIVTLERDQALALVLDTTKGLVEKST